MLEELRLARPDSDAPARVQLWPEHFDLSVDFGDESAGRRATYGASPGDAAHDLPYLYVTPWAAPDGEFWNEGSFASLSLAALCCRGRPARGRPRLLRPRGRRALMERGAVETERVLRRPWREE